MVEEPESLTEVFTLQELDGMFSLPRGTAARWRRARKLPQAHVWSDGRIWYLWPHELAVFVALVESEGWAGEKPDGLTPAEAAGVIGVGRQTIYNLVASGSLDAVRWQGKVYVTVASVHRHLSRREQRAMPKMANPQAPRRQYAEDRGHVEDRSQARPST